MNYDNIRKSDSLSTLTIFLYMLSLISALKLSADTNALTTEMTIRCCKHANVQSS